MATTLESAAGRQDLQADARAVAYWASLGLVAGGLGGLAAGGIGGRLAMFVLRVTSDESVRGIKSDDGFVIGRFDFTSTVSLLIVTMFLGSFVGLFVVLGRPFFPERWMPFAWALAGATAGGAGLVHSDGVDFTLLEPQSLAVALFVAIPGAGAGFIAWLVEWLPRYWWKQRWATGLLSLGGLGAVIFFPVVITAVAGGLLWLAAGRNAMLRRLPRWKPARASALLVFAAVVAQGGSRLIRDVQDVL